MALLSRVGTRLKRLLSRPASVDLARYEALLPRIGELEPELEELSDTELAERAAALRRPATSAMTPAAPDATPRKPATDFDDMLVEVCALGRKQRGALGERASTYNCWARWGCSPGTSCRWPPGGQDTGGCTGRRIRPPRQASAPHLGERPLARRDAQWMRPVSTRSAYRWAGSNPPRPPTNVATPITVRSATARSARSASTLRDRPVTSVDELTQPELQVAIVDEADSVLVDEARVPLVMAGSVDAGVADEEVARIVGRLRRAAHETDPTAATRG